MTALGAETPAIDFRDANRPDELQTSTFQNNIVWSATGTKIVAVNGPRKYDCAQLVAATTNSSNCLNSDPLFVDVSASYYHQPQKFNFMLRAGSPVIAPSRRRPCRSPEDGSERSGSPQSTLVLGPTNIPDRLAPQGSALSVLIRAFGRPMRFPASPCRPASLNFVIPSEDFSQSRGTCISGASATASAFNGSPMSDTPTPYPLPC